MRKAEPCTLGPKHKWTWLKNITNQSITYSSRGTSVRMSLRGLYKCECGLRKEGQANHSGPDLRELVDGGAA